jgi:1-aminocyclopropane-1-carboxylate deaminase/D-cysteine desulfhydrase-like pyridoxal-dependent ACC family enzyme
VEPEPPLYAAFPDLRGRVPWMPLGRFPTRVERVRGLAPDGVELWVKRDDESGVEYGGNKVRKLEFLLAEARASGATRLCTLGGIGSHHVLATAIYGAREGFEVEAVVFPQPLTAHVREQILGDAAAGALLTPTRGYMGVPLAVWRGRRKPRTAWIAAGGSSATGTLGYVNAGLELLEQIRCGNLPQPDVVYVALGSCGTAAGLLVGLRELGPALELVGVRVVDRLVSNAGKVSALAGDVLRLLAPEHGGARHAPAPRLRVEHGFFGGAYGRATAASESAVRDAAAAGVRLETTYTGKTMAALLADARAGRLNGKRVLFWHTYSGADLAPLLARAPKPEALPPLIARCFDAR